MLNLSPLLLTSDMWAVLIPIFPYHEKVDWIYFVGFAGTAAWPPHILIQELQGGRGASDEQGKAGDEEAGMQNPA
uniref:Uncharacterized protein n=1 Tax=Oryza sativa subsp. japonica TaxID=39947 RepID=Q84QK9_ORYSJ|nr:hypothetical protein [Oryza sativa Japonica Group]